MIGGANPPDERKEGDANVCYISGLSSDGIFIVALVGLCYTILSRKKIAATTEVNPFC